MDHFELVSEYQPTGDQPQAIEQLVQGFKEGNQFQTLLGVTGSGKTFTMANVIQALNKPTLIIAHTVSYTHLIAAQAVGIKEIPTDFGKTMAKSGRMFYPKPENVEIYKDQFEKYKKLYQSVKQLF